jgi:hypothetical protein
MTKPKVKAYPKLVRELMAKKTTILSKAQMLSDMGMSETALALWSSAGSYEERLAPLLEAVGRELEAAVHRISAASCYRRAGELSRAANLYRAALAGPLREDTREDVQEMLADCLKRLAISSFASVAPGPRRKATTGT